MSISRRATSRRSAVSFANTTKVPQQKTRADIEQLLQKHGATSFAFGTHPDRGVLMFELHARRVRFIIPLPLETVPKARRDQLIRSRWRALLLVVKAKLEAVLIGVSVFEDEFLSSIVMSDGTSFGEWARPQIAAMYNDGKMPPMLPGGFG